MLIKFCNFYSILIVSGELILKEDCICWGPNHELEECVCVECLNLIPDYEQEKVRWCENCKLPLCLNHCQSHPTHDIECKIVASYRSSKFFYHTYILMGDSTFLAWNIYNELKVRIPHLFPHLILI